MLDERLKQLEIEVAYLRKGILDLIDMIEKKELETHYHLTNIFLNSEHLGTFKNEQ